MTDETILANAQLILEGEIIRGSVRLLGGDIAEIGQGRGVPPGAVDVAGGYVAPGLIELHTDNLERHLMPRPRVDWPPVAAILAHDRELAGNGITTVFDALRVGSILSTGAAGYRKYARQISAEIAALRQAGALRIAHHIHLRAEICSETLLEELDEFSPDDRIGILSMMDHTPGQRQFADLAKFEAYIRAKRRFTDDDWAGYLDLLRGLQDRLGAAHEAAAVTAATRLGATLASHDDTTPAQVETSQAHGVTVAEFPTTVAAAEACAARDIAIVMGAPNLMRGASHSGNVSAKALAGLGRLDILSSDYVPAALLMGAVRLGAMWGDMAQGIATVTAHPAAAVGLSDRGVLRPGGRGDVIWFNLVGEVPVLQQSYCAGRRVF